MRYKTKSDSTRTDAEPHDAPRSIQVIATVTGAFTLPLMVYLLIGGQTSPLREFTLLCIATTIGAATGFAFFLPKGSFALQGSLLRKVGGGTAVGLVMGSLTFSRLQMPPLASGTVFGLCIFAALGAVGAWALSLRDDFRTRRRRGEAVVWPVKVFFCNGLLSFGAWVAVWAAGCIGYIVFDITQVASGRKLIRVKPPSLALNSEYFSNAKLGLVSRTTLPGQTTAEEIATRLIDRGSEVLGNVEMASVTSAPPLDAMIPSVTVDLGTSDSVTDPIAEPAMLKIPEEAEAQEDNDVTSFDKATIPELLAVIEDHSSTDRSDAALALDRFDPHQLDDRLYRKAMAKAYKTLAFGADAPELQPAGVRGMVRWGGKFSVPYLIQLLEREPHDALEAELLSALDELNDPRGDAAIAKLVEQPEYRDATDTSRHAMDSVAEPDLPTSDN